MVKRLSVIFAVFFAFCSLLTADQADEKKLLSKVPHGAEVVLSVDMTQWLQLPALKKGLTESRDVAVFYRNSQLQPADISAITFWMKDETMALLVALKKKFYPEKVFSAPRFICRKSNVSGVVLYDVESTEVPRAARKHQVKKIAFAVALLPGNTIAFFADSAAAAGALKVMKGKTGFSFPAKVTGSLRGMAGGGKLPVKEAFLYCCMTGAAQKDFSGTLDVQTASAEEAEQLKGQVMLMFNMFLFQYMQKKPELATEILQAVKFDSAGDRISVKASLSAALLDRLGAFAATRKAMTKRKAAERRRSKKSGVPAK